MKFQHILENARYDAQIEKNKGFKENTMPHKAKQL